MRSLPLLVLLVSTVAVAQPKPSKQGRPYSFAKATTYQSCSTSWAFACGMHDASGNTYGTAQETKMCTTYTFEANGTYTSNGDGPGMSQGRYLLHDDGSVTLFQTKSDRQPPPKPYDLQLSKLTLLPE
ncbi:MAG TPA: hypothetical protein VGM90_13660 [Kofleriaceae bacterium]|jgi:hypothetical protein